MNIANAHNVPNLTDKFRAVHRPMQIIAEPPTLVGEGMTGHLRQKLTSGFPLFVGFFLTVLNFRFFQPKS